MTRRKILLIIAAKAAFTAALLAYANWPIKPLPPETKADLVIIDKGERQLHLSQNGQVFATYPVSLGRADGAKQVEGNNKTPEGRYSIDFHKPDSAYHKALHIDYPNTEDQARTDTPGSDIMIHGLRNGTGLLGRLHRLADWTRGCIALTNDEMEQIYPAVPDGTPVEIKP